MKCQKHAYCVVQYRPLLTGECPFCKLQAAYAKVVIEKNILKGNVVPLRKRQTEGELKMKHRLTLTLLCLLIVGGCSHTEATYKNGVATVKRTRFLMTEDIDSFSYDATDGSFTLDGYKSDMTRALDLIDKLTQRADKVKIGGKAVLP